MASHDDDTMPEETQGYKLSQPKQSLAEYQQMGRCSSSPYPDFRPELSSSLCRACFCPMWHRLANSHQHDMMILCIYAMCSSLAQAELCQSA